MKLHRDLAGRNCGDQVQEVQMASARYVQTLADPVKRVALLAESRALLASLPASMKPLKSVRF